MVLASKMSLGLKPNAGKRFRWSLSLSSRKVLTRSPQDDWLFSSVPATISSLKDCITISNWSLMISNLYIEDRVSAKSLGFSFSRYAFEDGDGSISPCTDHTHGRGHDLDCSSDQQAEWSSLFARTGYGCFKCANARTFIRFAHLVWIWHSGRHDGSIFPVWYG